MWITCKGFEAAAALVAGLRVQARAPHTVCCWVDVFFVDGKPGIYYEYAARAVRLGTPGTMEFRREQSDNPAIEAELAGERGVEQRVRDFLTTRASKQKTTAGRGQT